MSEKHLSSQFDTDLTSISTKVLQMGGLVEAQIARANGDRSQQQDATQLFDNAYLTYRRFINRTCRPKPQMHSFLI